MFMKFGGEPKMPGTPLTLMHRWSGLILTRWMRIILDLC